MTGPAQLSGDFAQRGGGRRHDADSDSGNNYGSESGWSGSGGGISSYESQPAYQNGVVTQSTTMRTDPDVSYDADPNTGFPGLRFLQQRHDDALGPSGAAPATPRRNGPPWWPLPTRAGRWPACPRWTAPRRRCRCCTRLPAGDFHDITTGGSTGSPAYSCGPGYDLVTGRGTPYANLLDPRPGRRGRYTNTTLGVSASTITYGQSVTLTATVSRCGHRHRHAQRRHGHLPGLRHGDRHGGRDQRHRPFTTSTLGYGSHQSTASYSGGGRAFPQH